MQQLNGNRSVQIQLNIIALLIGLLVGLLLGASSIREVLYVSQDEILSFEYKRVAGINNEKEKQLFYGKAQDAMRVIEQLVEERGKSGDIVITSKNKVKGSNVRSISGEIHEQMVINLTQGGFSQ